MIHLLIGLTVTTLLIIGCYAGNLFACVFVTLIAAPIAIVGLFAGGTLAGFAFVISAAVLAAVWLRRSHLLHH